MAAFTPLRDFEADYEVEIDEPHRIRRIGSNAFVTTSLHHSGYYYIALNGRSYQLHRILAKHFIPNPDNLPQVDHIDRNPLNNSIENLRWVSNSDNLRNRGRYTHQRREYLNAAPNDITEIRTFNGVEYAENKYFFCFENDKVVLRINNHKWQFLNQTPHNGFLRIAMRDINGRQHHICMHKLIHHFRHEPAEQ